MELIEGGSLRPLLDELSLPKIARMLEDLLAAVGYAGRAGIVHRDLKHENALITKEGRLKVADFGIAKVACQRSGGPDVGGHDGRHAGVHVARAGARARRRPGLGPLLDRLHDLRDADRPAAVRPASRRPRCSSRTSTTTSPTCASRSADPRERRAVGRADDPEGPRRPLSRRRRRMGVLRGGGARVHRPAVAPRRDDRARQRDRPVGHPPQSDTPLRPREQVEVPARPGGATGYQTYHAPAALHELVDTATRPAAPAVVTPPPRPAARPPRRHARPPVPPSPASRSATAG